MFDQTSAINGCWIRHLSF